MGFKKFFTESSNGELLVVDIQPEYEVGSYGFSNHFETREFCEWINDNHQNFSKITFLYNGEDTLGMISESDYKDWLFENELHPDIVDSINFYDKGYGFFRYAVDEGVDEDEIVDLLKFMAQLNIHDTRDVDEEMWDDFISVYPDHTNIRELMEDSGDAIHIPDLIDELNDKNNLTVCGGSRDECLLEVLICLKYLGKTFRTLERFIY